MENKTQTIYAKLVAFRKNLPKIELDSSVSVKTKSGKDFSYRYASLQQIIEKCNPVLAENGIGFYQTINNNNIETYLFDDSGSIKAGEFPISLDGTMQDIGGRITYAKRYSLVAALGISAETDNDAQDVKAPKKPKTSEEEKPWLNSPKIEEAKHALDNGEVVLNQILAKYRVSKHNLAYLKGEEEFPQNVVH